jgi:hypothetical protein
MKDGVFHANLRRFPVQFPVELLDAAPEIFERGCRAV